MSVSHPRSAERLCFFMAEDKVDGLDEPLTGLGVAGSGGGDAGEGAAEFGGGEWHYLVRGLVLYSALVSARRAMSASGDLGWVA